MNEFLQRLKARKLVQWTGCAVSPGTFLANLHVIAGASRAARALMKFWASVRSPSVAER